TAIVTGDNLTYNYQGVTGPAYNFVPGQTIVVTWYNNSASNLTFTPNISFNGSSRIYLGGTWYAMSQATIPAFGSATTQYTFTSSSAGSYSLVSVNNNFSNTDVLICNMIQLVTGSAGSDTQAPTAPTSLTATASSSSAINLSWTA